eukprot:754960-Hanusia_phi.AAC.1
MLLSFSCFLTLAPRYLLLVFPPPPILFSSPCAPSDCAFICFLTCCKRKEGASEWREEETEKIVNRQEQARSRRSRESRWWAGAGRARRLL